MGKFTAKTRRVFLYLFTYLVITTMTRQTVEVVDPARGRQKSGHEYSSNRARLSLALFTANLAAKPANARRTWGYGRAEVLSATAQATALLGMGIFVLIEGTRRLIHPPEIPSASLAIFGTIGILGNLASLETANHALGSAAVLVAAAMSSRSPDGLVRTPSLPSSLEP